jgi:hypothetical protein
MTTIQIDDETAVALQQRAAAAKLDVGEYLRRMLRPEKEVAALDLDRIERELEELSLPAPSLPPDFSRADIYIDHD